MTTNELYHHGILGMKWGVRRYQNEDGSLTDAGKRRRGLASRILKKEPKLTPEEKAQKDAEEKERLINTGSATEVAKYMKKNKGAFTNDELKNITTRFGYEQKVAEISQKEIEAGSKWAQIDKLTKNMKTVNDFWTQGNKSLENLTNTVTNASKVAKLFGKKKEVEKVDNVAKAINGVAASNIRIADKLGEAIEKSGSRASSSSQSLYFDSSKFEKTSGSKPGPKTSDAKGISSMETKTGGEKLGGIGKDRASRDYSSAPDKEVSAKALGTTKAADIEKKYTGNEVVATFNHILWDRHSNGKPGDIKVKDLDKKRW